MYTDIQNWKTNHEKNVCIIEYTSLSNSIYCLYLNFVYIYNSFALSSFSAPYNLYIASLSIVSMLILDLLTLSFDVFSVLLD